MAPVFEKYSIDEFYMDVSGMDKYFGCFQWGKELRQKTIKETGLPLSIGLSVNKLVSKVATGEAKPNNTRRIAPGMETAFVDSNFDTESRQKKISYTANDETLIRYAKVLFDQLCTRRMLIRMIVIRTCGLVQGNYQINLFDDTQEHIQLFQAMDTIRNQHGIESIMRANTVRLDKRLREKKNMFKGE